MRIGIMGGGQLARMMALAGHPLGLEFVFIDPAPDACARSLGEHKVIDWSAADLVSQLAGCDRVTFDFENVPAQSLETLAAHFDVRPSPKALEISQDRLAEKELCASLGIPVAPFQSVDSRPDLMAAMDGLGLPALLKTRRLGYDGKGQYRLVQAEDLEPAWQSLGEQALILEGWVDFDHECALTAVRNANGTVLFYPLTHTLHREGILRFALSGSPANVPWQKDAQEVVTQLMERLDYVGCLTVEFFVTAEGLVVNELAPRVHNSAHWTIEGAVCSQFENHLRALTDLPLGATRARGCALMINFIGQMPIKDMLALDGLSWHDYGKQARAGRKVGHATWLLDDFESLKARAGELAAYLDPIDAQGLTGLIKAAG